MSPQTSSQIEAAAGSIKELFWRRGFDDTSIEDVVQATGLNRYALYNAFGGKLEIFLAALDAYYQERKAVFLSNLDDPGTPPLDAVRRVFEFAIGEMAERGSGCLMCNVASGASPLDPMVAKCIQSYQTEIRAAYTDALQRAENRNELNACVSASDGAELLIALKFGLGVHAKNGASREMMLGVFNTAMALLENPDAR